MRVPVRPRLLLSTLLIGILALSGCAAGRPTAKPPAVAERQPEKPSAALTDFDGDGQPDQVSPAPGAYGQEVRVTGSGGRTLLAERLGGDWTALPVDVGAPIPALLVRDREQGSRVYLYDPATGTMRLVPWQSPWLRTGEHSLDMLANLAARPNEGAPGLLIRRGGFQDARGHEVEYLYTYDQASRRLVRSRVRAFDPGGAPKPEGPEQLVRLLLEALTFRVSTEVPRYFAEATAGERFLRDAPDLPVDTTVTRVQLGAARGGRIPFGAELEHGAAVVRGWVSPAEVNGALRATAAEITEVYSFETGRGADLDGDGTAETVTLTPHEVVVRSGRTGAELLRRQNAAAWRVLPVRAGAPLPLLWVREIGGSGGQGNLAYLYSATTGKLEPVAWKGRFSSQQAGSGDPSLWGFGEPPLLEDGIVVRFRFHDPANHWYVALYRYQDGALTEVRGEFDETVLRYPDISWNVLFTAFQAVELRRPEELKRYFVNPADAEPFYRALPPGARGVTRADGPEGEDPPVDQPFRWTAVTPDGKGKLTGTAVMTKVDGLWKIRRLTIDPGPAPMP